MNDQFPTEVADLPEALAPQLVELSDVDEFDLGIAPVAKRLGEATARMLAYTLDPRTDPQGAGGLGGRRQHREPGRRGGHRTLARPAARHRYDGTHHTQHPITVGERFRA